MMQRKQVEIWGKTALKLGIASTVATMIAEALHLDYPFYAAIAPVIVMGQTRGLTLRASFNRIKGTIVGTIVGAIAASLFGDHVWALLVSVPVSVFLCSYLGLADAMRLAGFVSAVVILNHNSNPWLYAGGRFAETCIGILSAIGVEEVLWTPRAAEHLRQTVSPMLIDLGRLYQLVFDCYMNGNYQSSAIAAIKQQWIENNRRAEKLWQEAISEQHHQPWIDETWQFLLQRLWEHIRTMDAAAETKGDADRFCTEIQPELDDLARMTVIGLNGLADAVKTGSAPHMPDLDNALLAVTDRLNDVQRQPAAYSPAELRRFFSFVYSMEEIADKLKRMSRRF